MKEMYLGKVMKKKSRREKIIDIFIWITFIISLFTFAFYLGTRIGDNVRGRIILLIISSIQLIISLSLLIIQILLYHPDNNKYK